jgi:general secretion pathway protein G
VRRIAFTLVEMMIVVAIIVVLAGAATYYMAGSIDKANESKAAADIKSITDACVVYKSQHSGQWPTSLNDLCVKDSNGYGPYLSWKNPEDQLSPWGSPYQMDPAGANNQGLQPDVYAQIPNGGRVVNWSRKIQQ